LQFSKGCGGGQITIRILINLAYSNLVDLDSCLICTVINI
jgi:hypothetical protein